MAKKKKFIYGVSQHELTVHDKVYEVVFIDDSKAWRKLENKRGVSNTGGLCLYQEKVIFVFARKWSDGDPMFEDMQKVLAHEVGHAIEHDMVGGVSQKEYIPSVCEMYDRIAPNVERCVSEYRDAYNKKEREMIKNGK